MIAGKLWTAPEILRENVPGTQGTQRGDVYSFAVICYEILQRSEPYTLDNVTPRGKIRAGGHYHVTLRGKISAKGHYLVTPRGKIRVGGHYHVTPRGKIRVGGHYHVTPRGKISVGGHYFVTPRGI